MLPSHAEAVARHRRLQRLHPRHGNGRVCQLIAVLSCFQILVVATLISVVMLTQSQGPQSPVAHMMDAKFRHLETLSGPVLLDQWLQHLLTARTVSLQISSTHPAHLRFNLYGTLVPRPSYPGLFDGELAFGDARDPRRYVVIFQNRGYEWIAVGEHRERRVYNGCLHPAQVPPLHKLRGSFATAHRVTANSVMFAFADELFRVTKSNTSLHVESSSGLVFQLSADVAPHDPFPDFVSTVHKLPTCPTLFDRVEATPHTIPETFEAISKSTFTEQFAENECPCTSQEKKCLFLHGIGVHEDVGLVDTYADYWGSIEKLLPCCSIVKFMHLNSVDSPWYDELFAQRVCDAMVSVADNSPFTLSHTIRPRTSTTAKVKNTVVVAHSTGNLYLASALLYKKCQLDPNSSRWIAIQGPMRGTNTANRVLEECAKPASGWNTLVQSVVREFELCPVKNSTKSLALEGTAATSGCLDTLFAQAQLVYEAEVYANLCGVSPFGLASTSSAKFVALAKFSNHSSSDNDGVVAFDSCAKPATPYTTTYRSRFYRASINHDDGRLIHGDGLWGTDRKPTQWLQCQF